jgi:hypothetical protein
MANRRHRSNKDIPSPSHVCASGRELCHRRSCGQTNALPRHCTSDRVTQFSPINYLSSLTPFRSQYRRPHGFSPNRSTLHTTTLVASRGAARVLPLGVDPNSPPTQSLHQDVGRRRSEQTYCTHSSPDSPGTQSLHGGLVTNTDLRSGCLFAVSSASTE